MPSQVTPVPLVSSSIQTTPSATPKVRSRRKSLQQRLTLMSNNIEALMTSRGIRALPVGASGYKPSAMAKKVDSLLTVFTDRDNARAVYRQKLAAVRAAEAATLQFVNQVDHGVLAFITKSDPDVEKVGITAVTPKARKPSVKRRLKSAVVQQNRQQMLAANQAVMKSSGDFIFNTLTGQVTPPSAAAPVAEDAPAAQLSGAPKP